MARFLPTFRSRRDRVRVLAACGAVVLGIATAVVAGVGRQSQIVVHFDGTGTSVVKPFPDGSSFLVENFWTNNSANGIQRFANDTYAFVNCLPQHRTRDETTLGCRVYDPSTGQWGEPIESTVGYDFLNGDFENTYDSLYYLAGDYVTFLRQQDGSTAGYSLRFLNVARANAGFPFFVLQTNPPTLQAFALRNADLPDGTTEATNFTVGLQTEDLCIDLDVTPVATGRALSGTYGARRRNQDGTCGATVYDNRSISIIPSGEDGMAGQFCRSTVTDPGDCVPEGALSSGDRVCIACPDACVEYPNGVTLAISTPLGDAYCNDVQVDLDDDAFCSASCDGKKALPFVAQ